MKILLLAIIIVLSSTNVVNSHPVHVSIINITFDGLLMKVSVSTFADDWETAYFHYFGETIKLNRVEKIKGEWFETYFNDSFYLKNKNGDKFILEWDTIYINDHSIKLEMHAKLNPEVNSLYIYNSILTDIFADQTNLLIYSVNGKEQGIRFDYYKKNETVNLR